jgi:hypothetical protein
MPIGQQGPCFLVCFSARIQVEGGPFRCFLNVSRLGEEVAREREEDAGSSKRQGRDGKNLSPFLVTGNHKEDTARAGHARDAYECPRSNAQERTERNSSPNTPEEWPQSGHWNEG